MQDIAHLRKPRYFVYSGFFVLSIKEDRTLKSATEKKNVAYTPFMIAYTI
jgi:hypothetical protein